MVELVIMIAVLAIVVMGWSKINNALDWTGNRISDTTDVLTDITKAGSIQTSRAVAISQDSLEDTLQMSLQKASKRQEERAKFESKLTDEQKKAVSAYEQKMAKILSRN